MKFLQEEFVESGVDQEFVGGTKYVISPAALSSPRACVSSPEPDWPRLAIESRYEVLVGSLGVYCLSDATIKPDCYVYANQGVIANVDLLPSFYGAHWRPLSTSAIKTVDCAIFFLSPNYAQYGHFLTEVLPRLLVLRAFFGEVLPFAVLLPRNLPSFVTDTLNLLFPSWRSIELQPEESVTVSKCLLPSMAAYDHVFHPALQPLISNFVDGCLGHHASNRGRKLFISRRNFRSASDFRILMNEAELAARLAELGFEVVRPEEFSLADQIEMFSQAKIVVGEAGSAMHNAIFSGFWTKVVSLNYVNSVQDYIARLRGHRITFVNPADGILRNRETPVTNPGVSPEYIIDYGQLETKLRFHRASSS